MTEQEFKDYVSNRFHDQREWCDEKSSKYKWWHQAMLVGTIVLAGSAPIVTALVPVTAVPVVVSGIVSILAGLHQASRFKELWTTYRATSEALKREWYLFTADLYHYSGKTPEDKRAVFVERVEELLIHEHALWIRAQKRQADDKSGPGSLTTS